MITVFLRGGLGNQMFQYALGLSLAKKNRTGLFLDTVFLNDRFPRKEFAYRTFDLDVFQLQPRLTALSKISAAAPIPGAWLALDFGLMKTKEVLGIKKVIKEKKENVVDPDVLRATGNLILWGRWQNEEYFKDIADDIKEAFRFRCSLTGEAKEFAEKVKSCNSVSLHVRRGDFATLKTANALMGDTDLSYYERAVAYVGARVKDPVFFVISDDIAWCRENVKINFPATYVPAEAAGSKGECHLELMSLCKHNIVANSTFSWWGAWLNRNPEKIVVAPKRWYADSARGDFTPAEWVKI
jgi:hypothetical protein